MNRSIRTLLGLVVLPLAVASCSDRESGGAQDIVGPEAWHGSTPERPTMRELAAYRWDSMPRGARVAWEWIGPEGGSVELHGFEIVVPAGAVDQQQRFSIRLPPWESRQARFVHAAFEPHNVHFNVPVTLRTPLAGTTSEGYAAQILWWEEPRNGWVELPTIPTDDGRLEIETDHFSIYGTQRTARGVTVAGG